MVFDLELDVDEHAASLAGSGESATTSTGRRQLGLGHEVTFTARHFGLRWRMSAAVTALERPHRFVDEQVRGPFAAMRHEHLFEALEDGRTRMVDRMSVQAPFGPLGAVVAAAVLGPYLRRLLRRRAAHIKAMAESAGQTPPNVVGDQPRHAPHTSTSTRTVMVTRRPRPSPTARRTLLTVNAVGAAASFGFAVRGLHRPAYVQPLQDASPLASFWAASSAVRTTAITASVLGSALLRERAAPEMLTVAGLVQLGDSALGAWQRKPDMTLVPAVMGLVHLVSARWLAR